MRRPLRAGRARFELAIGLPLYVLSRDAPSANSATSPNSGDYKFRYFSENFQAQILEKILFVIFIRNLDSLKIEIGFGGIQQNRRKSP